MKKIAFDQLSLVDLQGKPIDLRDYFEHQLLLIFLRHLA